MNTQTETTNILHDIEQDLNLEQATVGARFVNYLIDLLLFYGFLILAGAGFGVVFLGTGEQVETSFLFREDSGAVMLQYLVFYFVYIVTYTVIEGAAKGKTLGKLITGTRAVKTDGTDLSWRDAFMRSLCRIVPFEPFSAFGANPWHDKWTNTTVVKERR